VIDLDLGGVRVRPLLDAEGAFLTLRSAFPSAPGLSDEPWTLPFCAFLVETGTQRLLVDAGIGPQPGDFLPERQGWLPSELASAGIEPDGIDVVFLTHLHVDHVGWSVVDGRPFFPRARYLVSSDDWQFFSTRTESQDVFQQKLAPLERRGVLELLDYEPSRIEPSAVAFPTPGHTPGHMSLRVTGGERELVILGDVALHPLQMSDPAIAYIFDVDAARAASTRDGLLGTLAAEQTAAAVHHFTGSCFGRVSRGAAGFEWHPLATYTR
jgi:glyoxylase-like metal-dependent hydrolase (beta-lactamase superfamily II)